MFFAAEPQTTRVYVRFICRALFRTSQPLIGARKIALRDMFSF